METAKTLADLGSFATLFAVFMDAVPSLAALLSLVWILMRMYETWLNIQHRRRALESLK